MGYPKAPGVDAEAHRRVVEKSLAQTKLLRDLEHWLSSFEEMTENPRLDWLQAFAAAALPKIRRVLDPGEEEESDGQ